MTIGFVAVVLSESSVDRAALLAAGATTVLDWAELSACTEADDVPAVVFDLPDLIGPFDAQLAAVLTTLMSVDPLGSSTGCPGGASVPADQDVVIATVRPVVDTLKLVDGAGVLTGTAQRDEHRFVGAPIAVRLRVLRAISREMPRIAPPPVAVLAALAARGATVLGSSQPGA